MKTSNQKNIAGFTLVDLLVVIAIIAMLISLVMPATLRGMDTALTAACLSSQRQLLSAASLYAADHEGQVLREEDKNGRKAPWRLYLVGNSKTYQREGPVGWGELYPLNYVTDSRLFYCPAREKDRTLTQNKHRNHWGKVGNGGVDWRAPMNSTKAAITAGYMFNAYRIERFSRSEIAGTMNNFNDDTHILPPLPANKQVLVFDMIRHSTQLLYHQGDLLNIALVDGSARSHSALKMQVRANSGIGSSLDARWDLFDLLMEDVVGSN